jgi:probable HAF family extracellular repeat protein
MVDLGTLGGTFSQAIAVNASGQVVGFSTTAGGETHAFSWTQTGGMVDLGTLGGTFNQAIAVNASGQVVGFSTTAGGDTHAFSWTQTGGMVDLGTLGGTLSRAIAVNASGQVVGFSSTTSTGVFHPVLWNPAVDTTPPLITVPADITVNATTPAGANVAYTVTATDDVDGPVPVTCAPPSGSTFPIGTTQVDCTATDAAGNAASASFTVHVKGAPEQVADLLVLVDSFNLRLLGTALHDKLIQVQAFLAANKPKRACNSLGAARQEDLGRAS